jgi:Kef-type K+ transport system membrane component KefB
MLATSALLVVLQIVVVLAAILVLGRLLACVLKPLAQPPVIGEMLAGMLLGPSGVGWLGVQYFGWERPVWLSDAALQWLGHLAALGAISYLFLVGVELDGGHARARWRQAGFIALAGMLVPLGLGMLMAYVLRGPLAPPKVPAASFALFFGVALSVTAFPVLARILQDRRMLHTATGQLALACAAVADVAAWCLLAVVVGLVRSQAGHVAAVPVRAALYLGGMLLLVRPLLGRLDLYADIPSGGALAVVGAWTIAALSALGSHLAGLHALFGAFLCGALVPHEGQLAHRLCSGLARWIPTLLLPVFFAHAGLRLELTRVQGAGDWLLLAAIVGVATAGKVLATAAAARATGLDGSTGCLLGILMNTRGLMELIVLSAGLDVGVLTPRLYALLVLMALIATLATGPLVAWHQGTLARRSRSAP